MTNLITPTRRGFLGGLLAMPAIVRIENLMPVKLLYPNVMPFISGDPNDIQWQTNEFVRLLSNRLDELQVLSTSAGPGPGKLLPGMIQKLIWNSS